MADHRHGRRHGVDLGRRDDPERERRDQGDSISSNEESTDCSVEDDGDEEKGKLKTSAIFLDVDGVLSPSGLEWGDDDAVQCPGAPAPLSFGALARFVALVLESPGAIIVVSSDWRLDRQSSLGGLLSGLQRAGPPLDRVAGCTRDMAQHSGAQHFSPARRRVEEIMDWLRANDEGAGGFGGACPPRTSPRG